MDEHMQPRDERDDVWQDIGSRKPLEEADVQRLGSLGFGGERIVRRERDRQGNIAQGIGTNEPPLDNEARAAAHDQYLQIRIAGLEARRREILQEPESSDRTDKLARIRAEMDKLSKTKE